MARNLHLLSSKAENGQLKGKGRKMVMVNGLQAPQHIVNHIRNASAETGVDFSYLVKQARAESSFDPSAKAKSSSASGLYQFIESTWLRLSEKHGEKYGLAGLSQGEILERRNDPETASLMAAELARENKAHLERTVSGKVGATELYFAHFLGASGAEDFLNVKQGNGTAKAAYLFPAAAKANKNIFFDKDGTSKTLNEVYDVFAKKFGENNSKQTVMVEENHSQQRGYSGYVPVHNSTSFYQLSTSSSGLENFAPEIQKLVMSSYFMDMQMLNSFSGNDNQRNSGLFGSIDYTLFE